MTQEKIAVSVVRSVGHTIPGHPENPGRFEHFDRFMQDPFAERLSLIENKAAEISSLTSVHPQQYVEAIEQAAAKGPAFVDYGDTYVAPESFSAALNAVGSALEVVRAVIQNENRGGFALIRPPGHHATRTRAMGFCLFNNIAIAAHRAQSLGLKRIMIIDFDVHHGNGTQDIFEHDPDVLYLSTHQAGIYPGTGLLSETGTGDGRGTTVNVPLPPRAGDQAFARVFDEIVRPMCERFSPEILLISAGFDAHWNDPLASLQLSTSGYHHLGKLLHAYAEAYCDGRIVYLLEGGYEPQALSDNVHAIMCAMLGMSLDQDRLGPAPFPEPGIETLIQQVRSIHALA